VTHLGLLAIHGTQLDRDLEAVLRALAAPIAVMDSFAQDANFIRQANEFSRRQNPTRPRNYSDEDGN